MSFDFDQNIHREGTQSVKYDARRVVFGGEEVMPLWVADMDFAAPAAVTQALIERARHPVYGYSLFPESLYQAMIDWFASRHGWRIERDWILMAPGVVPSIHAAIMAFVQPGEGVIVQSPVYPPFFSSVQKTGRRLINNPLRLDNGRYRMDLEHLDRCAAEGARMLMLCSPHNPVGRVWDEGELRALLEITRRHGLILLSDDIHCDLVLPGKRHLMLADLAEEGDRIVTAVAPSKTFNIPGLGLSALVVPHSEHRDALKQVFETLHMEQANPFSLTAFEAAYRAGGPWLDALLIYLQENARFVSDYLHQHIPRITLIEPEGTYLLWLDCRELGLSDAGLKAFFIQQAGLGLNPGTSFGEGGSGFMRLNIGTRRANLQQAMEQLRLAVETMTSK
ncbi:MalY/PatB family protein [Pseudomonas saliphila]|uniref:MalY/PatB family protein n=1 Tax=Pseudomonas saliphila TaxID=2586906 RepID=UPI00123BE4E1|nr:pyridoxal phosphate-dependent aminotransferase [Pseudomonas saliphila]